MLHCQLQRGFLVEEITMYLKSAVSVIHAVEEIGVKFFENDVISQPKMV